MSDNEGHRSSGNEEEAFGRKSRVSRTPPTKSTLMEVRESLDGKTGTVAKVVLSKTILSTRSGSSRDSSVDSLVRGETEKRSHDGEEMSREKKIAKKRQGDIAAITREQEKMEAEFRRKAVEQRAEKEKKSTENMETSKITKEAEPNKEERARTTEMMGEVQVNLNEIWEAVSRETSGKVSVTRADQQVVKKAISVVQHSVIGFLIKHIKMLEERNDQNERIIELQKEVGELKSRERQQRGQQQEVRAKIQMGGTTKVNRGVEVEVQDRGGYAEGGAERGSESGRWKDDERMNVRDNVRSYADMARGREQIKESKGNKISGRMVIVGEEGWKIPPHREQEEIIISSKTEGDARKLAQQLATAIKVKEIGGAPKAVYTRRDGKVAIAPSSKEQLCILEKKISEMQGMEVRKIKNADPMLVITGVEAGLEESVFKEKLCQQNRDVVGMEAEHLRVIRRVPCRNPWRENWIVQVKGELFNRMVKKQVFSWDCGRLFIEEYLGMSMCFRCCRFGHIMKHCRQNEVCSECTEEHDSRECRKLDKECINCKRTFQSARGHSARDPGCPTFQKPLEESRRRTNYGGN